MYHRRETGFWRVDPQGSPASRAGFVLPERPRSRSAAQAVENPISEQRYQRRFNFGGREERPLEHPASALRRRRIKGVLVGLGEIEVNRRSLPHDKAAVIDSGHKSVRV